jgi:hypothetical protein
MARFRFSWFSSHGSLPFREPDLHSAGNSTRSFFPPRNSQSAVERPTAFASERRKSFDKASLYFVSD